ncbi:hypothetical protein DFJ74DRAFT_709271 [Hyaloraphidium curvatum]|nr:hypothetical protein DFJ74DRAFT_709271 [Hyaloraphidium curvatum]
MRLLAALLALALAVVATALPAAAAPGAAVLFARSCADCGADEYAHPDAPAGSVACVMHREARALYRRYDVPDFSPCSAVPCTVTVLSDLGSMAPSVCEGNCKTSGSCVAYMISPVTCLLYSAFGGQGKMPEIGDNFFVRGASSGCPASGTCPPS